MNHRTTTKKRGKKKLRIGKMHSEKRIKIKSFKLTTNPNMRGSTCAFNSGHFIDYKESCYIHPTTKIIICTKCRKTDHKEETKKYHNIPRLYNGHIYQSTFEAEFAKELDLKLKAGIIESWDKQVKIEINAVETSCGPVLTSEPRETLTKQGAKFTHIANYFMDFTVTHPDKSITFYEVKGKELAVWRLKFKLTEIIFRNKINLEVIKKVNYKPKRSK